MKSIDIVFPKNNEEVFLKRAKVLGIKEIIFLYPIKEYKESKCEEKGILVKTGILAFPTHIQIREAKKRAEIVVVPSDAMSDKNNIDAKPTMIYNFELQERKDFMHHRNSGLNQVLCQAMAENHVAYGFSVSSLLTAPKEKQAVILGRLHQNIMLAKKYDVEIILASFVADPLLMRNPKDVWCLGH